MRSIISNLSRSFVAVSLVLGGSQAFGQALLEQSPINITGVNAVYNPGLPALNFSYTTTSVSVSNTGSPGIESTIRVTPASGAGTLTLSSTVYDLLQFHFHAESEHAINGVRTPMEIHMVHKDSGNNLLVVGRQIVEGAENALLAPIFSNLPSIGNPLPLTPFDLSGLLPQVLTSYRYNGSLTTAPYTEGVQWVFLSEPLELSHSQIAAFEGLFPSGDTRELQNLNGRVIQTDVVGFAQVPEPESWTVIAGVALGCVAFGRRYLQKAS